MLKLKLEFVFESGIEKYERVRAYDREWAAKNRRKKEKYEANNLRWDRKTIEENERNKQQHQHQHQATTK